MFVTDSGIVILSNLSHPENASVPMLTTDEGILTLVICVLSLNAEGNPELSLNAEGNTLVTESPAIVVGIVTLVNGEPTTTLPDFPIRSPPPIDTCPLIIL